MCAGRVWPCSHHLLRNIPTALSEWLQLQLGSLLADFPVPAVPDGRSTNSITPKESFSLQLVCKYAYVRVCALQLSEHLSVVTCLICVCSQNLELRLHLSISVHLIRASSILEPTVAMFTKEQPKTKKI